MLNHVSELARAVWSTVIELHIAVHFTKQHIFMHGTNIHGWYKFRAIRFISWKRIISCVRLSFIGWMLGRFCKLILYCFRNYQQSLALERSYVVNELVFWKVRLLKMILKIFETHVGIQFKKVLPASTGRKR